MALVLVAEDEQFTRWSVSEFLRTEHYQVDEASDGKTAIELIQAKRFDVVISDYSMPGQLTGLDVLTHYHRRFPDKLKVLITGQDGEAQEEVKAIGGIYLQKPVFLEELIGIVNRRLNHRRMRVPIDGWSNLRMREPGAE
jgi:DNA-binding NtrC family response regulator